MHKVLGFKGKNAQITKLTVMHGVHNFHVQQKLLRFNRYSNILNPINF